jgi:hypothetical protein
MSILCFLYKNQFGFTKLIIFFILLQSSEFKRFEKDLEKVTKELEKDELGNNRRMYKQFVRNYSSKGKFSGSEFRKVKEQVRKFKWKFNYYAESETELTNVSTQSGQVSSRYAEDLPKNCQTSSQKHPGETQNIKQKEAELFRNNADPYQNKREITHVLNKVDTNVVHDQLTEINESSQREKHQTYGKPLSMNEERCQLKSYNTAQYTKHLKQDDESNESKRSLSVYGRKSGTTENAIVMKSSTETDGKDEPKAQSTQNLRHHALQSQSLDPLPEKMDTSEPPSDDTIIDIEKMDTSEPPSNINPLKGGIFSETSLLYPENHNENRYFGISGRMDTTVKRTSVPDLDNLFNKNSQWDDGYNKSRDVGSDEVDLKSTQVRESQENYYTGFQPSGQDPREVDRLHYDHRQERIDNCKQIEESGPGSSRQKHSEENVKQKNTPIAVENKEKTIESAEKGTGAEPLAPGIDNKFQTPSSKGNFSVAIEAAPYSDTNVQPVSRGQARRGRSDHIQRAGYLPSEQHKDENHHQPPTRQQNEKTQSETEASYGPALEAVEVDNSPLKILDFHPPSSKGNFSVAKEAAPYSDTNIQPVSRERVRRGKDDHTQRAGYLATEQRKDENHHQQPTRQQNEKTQSETEASYGPAVEAVEVDNSPLKILDFHPPSSKGNFSVAKEAAPYSDTNIQPVSRKRVRREKDDHTQRAGYSATEQRKDENHHQQPTRQQNKKTQSETEASYGPAVEAVKVDNSPLKILDFHPPSSKGNFSVAKEAAPYSDTNIQPVSRKRVRRGKDDHTQRAGYLATEQRKDENHHQQPTRQQNEKTQFKTEASYGPALEAVEVDNSPLKILDFHPPSSKGNLTVATEAAPYSDTNIQPFSRGRARRGRGDDIQRAGYLPSEQHKDENHHQPPTRQQNEKTQSETEASYGPAVEAVEVDNSPLKILDVHQYFRNDFDLKTLDDADHLTRIQRIGELAKNFEHPIQNFAEEKHSLEYFIFDEKLMRFIENLDKIKSQDEAVTREKVQVIEYIKGLHNTLDERALDD